MPVQNADIAATFEKIADILEIEDANPFRVRAYRTAARLIRGLSHDLSGMVNAGKDLTELPDIGEDLAKKIVEIVHTGHCSMLKKLETQIPPALTELLQVPGLGPKRVRTLWHELDVETVSQLAVAAREGRIRTIPGFAEKTEAKILQALQDHTAALHRFPIPIAARDAASLVLYLQGIPGVKQAVVAGSFRRGRETVGDLDLLVAAERGRQVMDHFTAHKDVAEIISSGPTRSTVILHNKLQVDLRVVKDEAYGAALQYFTGSKEHNIAIRRMGQSKGLKINEYGVFRDKERIAGETESSVYASIGLPYIEPELRENRGEIEAAVSGHLPNLAELGDLRGDLHVHCQSSQSLRVMADEAKNRGFEYLAVTLRSSNADPKRLDKFMAEIDAINGAMEEITLLKGIEVQIEKDGNLDLPDNVLRSLDLVIGGLFGHFDLPRERQTTRILKAMDNPHFSILAHPCARLIGTRGPIDADMSRIIRHARDRGCFLEINSRPDRLDLMDIYARMAKDEGAEMVVSSGGNSPEDFDDLRFGMQQAKRGWLEKKDIINTLRLKELRSQIAKTMGR